MPKHRAKRSTIWLYFYKCNEDANTTTVKCNVCDITVPYCGNTTNLWSHIRIHHRYLIENKINTSNQWKDKCGARQEFAACSILSDNISESSSSRNECAENTASENYEAEQKYPIDSKRADEITRSLVQMIANDIHPFSIINNKGFINFVKTLNGNYQLPHIDLLMSKYLPKFYMLKCEEIENKLSRTTRVHITLDSWTDFYHEMFSLSITAHYYIDGALQYNNLHVSYFPMWYTAENLCETLIETAESWKITSKIKTVVSDNTRSILDAVSMTSWPHIVCFCTTLNEVVQNTIRNSKPVVNMMRKCENIIHILKTSNEAAKLFGNQQIYRNLKGNDTTECNSTYLILNCMLELRSTLTVFLQNLAKEHVPCVTHEEWNLIFSITKILKPFYETTIEMCSDHYVTISKVIPIVHCIEVALKKQTNLFPNSTALCNNLSKELDRHFENIEANSIYAKATLLDPRYKDIVFNSEECVKLMKAQLINECSRSERKNCHSQTYQNNELTTDNKCSDTNDNLWAPFDERVQERETDTDTTSLQYELNRYFNLKVINRKSNPLIWWNTEGSKMFPQLAKLALEYLPIPASCMSSENLCSGTGQTFSNPRVQLQPKYVNMLAVLRSTDSE